MSILTQREDSIEGGLNKKIDAGAFGLMLDILQKYQYQFPIRSAIRELVSNGLDSIIEKSVATKILTGKNVPGDFFENRAGDLYKDSKWDPSYYDLSTLSDDDNVVVNYTAGTGAEKDSVTITDYGVGLGRNRLENYFNLGLTKNSATFAA